MERTKEWIIQKLKDERIKLEQTLARLNDQDLLAGSAVGEWSFKDVLAHLADWELHMIDWVEAARQGDKVKEPDPGLTWRQLDIFNQRIYEKHRDRLLADVKDYFHVSHKRFMEMVASMPEEEMLEKGRNSFTVKAAIYD